MITLGVDVGLHVCGYVIADIKGFAVTVVHAGEIKPPRAESLAAKLAIIYTELDAQAARYQPEMLALEILYSHHKHPTTLGALSHVRGVVLLLAKRKNMEIFECSPTRARKSFIGAGSCDSTRVKKMTEHMLKTSVASVHIADAFSLLVALSHHLKMKSMGLPKERSISPALAKALQ